MATRHSTQTGVRRTPARSAAATNGREIAASSAETLVKEVGESAKTLLEELAKGMPAKQVGTPPDRKVPLFFPNGIGFVGFELSASANRTEGLSAVLRLTVAGVGESHGKPDHAQTELHD